MSVLESIDETSGNTDNILESATDFDAGHVVDDADFKVGGIKDALQDLTVGDISVSNRRLTKLFLCHFRRNLNLND
jgi:hypothetical protein